MNKQEQAQQDYLSGMKYKDIASKHDVSISTVKSWKARYWKDLKKVATKAKKVASKTEKVATINNDFEIELSPQQELFCQLVGAKRIPLYRAYQIAYKLKNNQINSAMTQSSNLAKDKKIALRIHKISEEVASKHEWSLERVVDSLTFVHDEAKADVLIYGVTKSNTDAMINATDRLVNILNIDDKSKAQKDIIQSEAKLAKYKADLLTDPDSVQDRSVIVDDIE